MADEKQKGLTKQERVYRAIRERILSGAYGPGYRVVIDALAEEFGVSALPVREAIWRLEAEGLVVYRPNAGAQVALAILSVGPLWIRPFLRYRALQDDLVVMRRHEHGEMIEKDRI